MVRQATLWNRFWCFVKGHTYSTATGKKRCIYCGAS